MKHIAILYDGGNERLKLLHYIAISALYGVRLFCDNDIVQEGIVAVALLDQAEGSDAMSVNEHRTRGAKRARQQYI